LPVHRIGSKKLARLRKAGSSKTVQLPDLANYYVLCLPDGREDAVELIERFRRLEEVEHSSPVYKPVAPPEPPDFTAIGSILPSQAYLGPSSSNRGSNGIDAFFAWTVQGGDGAGVSICDIEYDWLSSHDEFSSNLGLRILGNDPLNPFGTDTRNHGTSVVGIYGSKNNGTGTKGIAFNVGKFCASVFVQEIVPWYNIAGAITSAMDALNPGDIIILEQHIPGPNHDVFGPEQNGFVPVEWYRGVYDAIRTATANGFIVVEAAGNGGQNLDDQVYKQNHSPFERNNSSGAIMVGAGNSINRSRLNFSNFGTRVDVQGWGQNVVTTAADLAKADAWSSDGPTLLYTGSFSGTSSATPIVAGACASLQGIYLARFGRVATPEEMLALLHKTASFQTGNIGEHIGPLPDLRQAIEFLDRSFPEPPEISPSGGMFASPATLLINEAPHHSAGVDYQTWFTTDGSEPIEGAPNATPVPWPTFIQIELTQAHNYIISAKTFFTTEINNERVSSSTTKANITVYQPGPGPSNVKASKGTFVEKIVVSWDALPDAIYYDVYTGSAINRTKVNASPVIGSVYEDGRLPGSGETLDYWIRAVLSNNKVTAYGGPARGRFGLAGLVVTASKGMFSDHVLVTWTYPSWNPRSSEIEFEILRALSGNRSQATSLARILPKYRVVAVGNHTAKLPDGIDLKYKDASVQNGQNYFYWVIAKEPAKDYQTPPSQYDFGFTS
jgi:hypothetical protein